MWAVPKPRFRRPLKAATQQHQVTDATRPGIGLGVNSGPSAALSETPVVKQPQHGSIRSEPFFSDNTAVRTTVSDVFSEPQATDGIQSVAKATRRRLVTRNVARGRNNNSKEPKQMIVASNGEEQQRVQTSPQGKVERTAAHLQKSFSRAREQQRATEVGQLHASEDTYETVGNENYELEEYQFLDTWNRLAADNDFHKSMTPADYQPDLRLPSRLLHQRYWPKKSPLSRYAAVHNPWERAERRSAAGKNLDRTKSAVHGAELQTMKYVVYRAPFDNVKDGYSDLSNTLWHAKKDCPGLERLWTYLTVEIMRMLNEFLAGAHQYRKLASIANGLRWSNSSWRRIVRGYYLRNPFVEYRYHVVRNIQALGNINTTRRPLGLGLIHGIGLLRADLLAFDKATKGFLECVKERDALGRNDAEKELGRKLGGIPMVIQALGMILRQLRLLLYDWNRPCYKVPSFHVRQQLYFCMGRLESNHTRLVMIGDELEVVMEKRILRRIAKSAVEPNSLLSEKAEARVGSSLYSSRQHQPTLNLHATAALSDAYLGGAGLLQSSPDCLFNPVEQVQGSGTSADGERLPDSCSFRIPEASRQNNLAASTSGEIYWQYNLYQGPAGERVKVHYCKNRESSDRIAKLFLDQSVVGFDIEWKPQASAAEGTKKNVSLIQLASEERIALFHIARFGKDGNIDDLVPPNLKKVMETPDITKVGVAVKADCTRLRKFMGIESRGILELSHLYKLIKFSMCDVKKINKTLVSLAQQVEEHLLLPMWKGEVRSSDWSEELNFQQIQCKLLRVKFLVTTDFPLDAASDSYAGLQLYHVMEAKRKALKPTPPCPAHAELNLPIRLANGQTVATYNEPDEVEDETPQIEPIANNDVLPEVEQMARDFLNITIEDVRQNKVTPSAKAKRPSKPNPEKAPEITAAEAWVAAWRTSLPVTYKAKAMPASLRAYAIWHVQGFGVRETASLLRDPPLQVTTVASYILDAVRMEKLAFDADRLKEVLSYLPESVAKSKYQSLRRQLE